jgi:hypothetical protein
MSTRPIYKLDNLYKPRPNIALDVKYYRHQEIRDLVGVALLVLLVVAVIILAFSH